MTTEHDRQRAIRLKVARSATAPSAAIPTGSAALDAALGVGGFPRGSIVELFGQASCGKTTLALCAVAALQKTCLAAAWIDADRTFDPGYAAALGISVEHLTVAQPASAEAALEIACRLAASCAVDLLVIDSAAALVPRLELEASLGDSGPGLQARVLASGLRKLSAAVARAGCVALFVNQIRYGISARGQQRETSAGGPALKLCAAVRIALLPAPGGLVRFRLLKNKVATPFAEGCLEGFPPGKS